MNDTSAAADDSPPGYRVHAEYLDRLVADQEDRKKSIEGRGTGVVTTSAALVSLLFGLVAVVTGVEEFTLTSAARPPLAVAMALFVVAGALGLLTNAPRNYENADAKQLADMLEDRIWTESELRAKRRVAATQRKVFARAQKVNGEKARLLFVAMFVQVVAVLSLAVAVAIIIWS